jgi:hypothetical protein
MSLADLLPSVRVNGAAATRAVQANDLYVPPQGMRKRSADTMLITAIDLEKRQIVKTLGISGSAETVYVSPNNLYLASSRYELRAAGGTITTFDPYGAATDIHQIRLGENGMTFVASGSVDGVIGSDMDKAPFQFSEDGGRPARGEPVEFPVGRRLEESPHHPRAGRDDSGNCLEERFVHSQHLQPGTPRQARRVPAQHAFRRRPALRGHVQEDRSSIRG